MKLTILFKALQVNIPVCGQDEVEEKRALFLAKPFEFLSLWNQKLNLFPTNRCVCEEIKMFKC